MGVGRLKKENTPRGRTGCLVEKWGWLVEDLQAELHDAGLEGAGDGAAAGGVVE